MTTCQHDATEFHRPARSRVGESLRRLQQHLEAARRSEDQVEKQFEAWQEKWSSRRDQIAQRLALIDSQLEQLVQTNPPKPQLSLVGAE